MSAESDEAAAFLPMAYVNCYRQKIGYGCERGFAVSRVCNTNYSIYNLDKAVGGCYPIAQQGKVIT
jgi:hypothetical protein